MANKFGKNSYVIKKGTSFYGAVALVSEYKGENIYCCKTTNG